MEDLLIVVDLRKQLVLDVHRTDDFVLLVLGLNEGLYHLTAVLEISGIFCDLGHFP